MGIGKWFLQNGFNLLSAGGVIAGLWFTAYSLRSDTKTKRIANLLSITANHREVWKVFLNDQKLIRVCDATADLTKHPITDAERIFVTLVIVHVNSVYYALNDELVIEYEGLRRDIAQFFSLPIPKSVWEENKQFQNTDFIIFFENAMN
jgi:hypothetical protein